MRTAMRTPSRRNTVAPHTCAGPTGNAGRFLARNNTRTNARQTSPNTRKQHSNCARRGAPRATHLTALCAPVDGGAASVGLPDEPCAAKNRENAVRHPRRRRSAAQTKRLEAACCEAPPSAGARHAARCGQRPHQSQTTANVITKPQHTGLAQPRTRHNAQSPASGHSLSRAPPQWHSSLSAGMQSCSPPMASAQ